MSMNIVILTVAVLTLLASIVAAYFAWRSYQAKQPQCWVEKIEQIQFHQKNTAGDDRIVLVIVTHALPWQILVTDYSLPSGDSGPV